MKVHCLKSGAKYTCNAYLVLGNWNAIDDINTLIDIGADGTVIEQLEKVCTGVGKRPVEQVILTHDHFDHSAGIKEIKARYKAKVYAYRKFNGVDETLCHGQTIAIADRIFEVMHVPEHSSDSICLFCRGEGVLFSGDTPLRIVNPGGTYCCEFVSFMERITKYRIRAVYGGHDMHVNTNLEGMLTTSLENIYGKPVLTAKTATQPVHTLHTRDIK